MTNKTTTVHEDSKTVATLVRKFIREEMGLSLPDGYGNKVYAHYREDGAEIVFEGFPDWAYSFQDRWCDDWEMQKSAPNVDVEIGMNGYCLEVVPV